MKISAAGRYAVRIVVDIAKNKNYVALSEVAKEQNISLKYAEQIANKLLKANILTSQRGQDGGYKLAHPATKTNICDILTVTGDVTPNISCDTTCPRKSECAGGDIWITLNQQITNYLSSVTIADLLNKNK